MLWKPIQGHLAQVLTRERQAGPNTCWAVSGHRCPGGLTPHSPPPLPAAPTRAQKQTLQGLPPGRPAKPEMGPRGLGEQRPRSPHLGPLQTLQDRKPSLKLSVIYQGRRVMIKRAYWPGKGAREAWVRARGVGSGPPGHRHPTDEGAGRGGAAGQGGARDRPGSLGLCLGEERFRNGTW